jgi:hypothetical protein
MLFFFLQPSRTPLEKDLCSISRWGSCPTVLYGELRLDTRNAWKITTEIELYIYLRKHDPRRIFDMFPLAEARRKGSESLNLLYQVSNENCEQIKRLSKPTVYVDRGKPLLPSLFYRCAHGDEKFASSSTPLLASNSLTLCPRTGAFQLLQSKRTPCFCK